jgi:hypothetical protein
VLIVFLAAAVITVSWGVGRGRLVHVAAGWAWGISIVMTLVGLFFMFLGDAPLAVPAVTGPVLLAAGAICIVGSALVSALLATARQAD